MGRVEINTRVINKHDTEANWNSHPSFIPDKSEIIVYDKDNNYNYPRVKIGDGVTTVVALPFIDDNTLTSVSNLQTEVNNVKASTSDEALNTKVNAIIQDIGSLTIDLNSAESGTVPFTNSDMLGGLPSSSYLQVTDFPQALTDAGVVKKVAGKTPNTSGEVTLVPADIGAIPTSRTVNGKALSSDISLTYSDIGAAGASHTHNSIVNSDGSSTIWHFMSDRDGVGIQIGAGTGYAFNFCRFRNDSPRIAYWLDGNGGASYSGSFYTTSTLSFSLSGTTLTITNNT